MKKYFDDKLSSFTQHSTMNTENQIIISEQSLMDSNDAIIESIEYDFVDLTISDETSSEFFSDEESLSKVEENLRLMNTNDEEEDDIVVMMEPDHNNNSINRRNIYRINDSFQNVFEELENKPILKNWTESLSIQLDKAIYYKKSKNTKYFRIYSKSTGKYSELMLLSNYNIYHKNGNCNIYTTKGKNIVHQDVDTNCIEFFSGSYYQIGNQSVSQITPKVKFVTKKNNRVSIIVDDNVVNDNIDYFKIKFLEIEKNYAYFDPFMCYLVKDVDLSKSFKYYKLFTVENVNGKNKFVEISKSSWSYSKSGDVIYFINGLNNNQNHPKYTYNNDTKLWTRVNGVGSMFVVRIITDKKCSTFTYKDEVHYGLNRSELCELYKGYQNNIFNVFVFSKHRNNLIYDQKIKKVIISVYGDIIPKTLPDTAEIVFKKYKSIMFEKFVFDVSEYLKNPNTNNTDGKTIYNLYENVATKSKIELGIIYDLQFSETSLNMYKECISNRRVDPLNIVEIYFMIIENDYIVRIKNCYPPNGESMLSEEFFVKHMINIVFKRDHLKKSDNARYIVDQFLKIKKSQWELELLTLIRNNTVVDKDTNAKTTKVNNYPYFYRKIGEFCRNNKIPVTSAVEKYIEFIRNELFARTNSYIMKMKSQKDTYAEIQAQTSYLKKYNQYKELVEGKNDILFEIKNLANLLSLLHRDPFDLILSDNFNKIIQDVIKNINTNTVNNQYGHKKKILGIYTKEFLRERDVSKYSEKAHKFLKNNVSNMGIWLKYFGNDFIDHPEFKLIIDCIKYENSFNKKNMNSYESLIKDIDENKLEDYTYMLHKYGPVVCSHSIFKGLVKLNSVRMEHQSKVDKYKSKQTEHQNNILSFVDRFSYILRDAKVSINKSDFSIKITKCMEETDLMNKDIKNNIHYILKDLKYIGESNISFEYDYEISPGVTSRSMNYGSYWTNGDYIVCLSLLSEKKEVSKFHIPGLSPKFGIHQNIFKKY